MSPTFVVDGKTPVISLPNNNPRRFSVISKQFDNEELNQQRAHVIDTEISQPLPSTDRNTIRRRLTQIISIVDNQNKEQTIKPKGSYLILFLLEPILTGCFLFPLLVLFWDCGWNLTVTMLNALNDYASNYNLDGLDYSEQGYGEYSPQSLMVTWVIDEIAFLIFYLGQDVLYHFLNKQKMIVKQIIVKIHIFILAFLYIIQWQMMWTILDQYTSQDWGFMFVFSLAGIFALMALTGTLSDLICAPFVVSYDSIEYCIQFECPLETEQMSRWKVNLMNFVLYEILISNITIIIWHGFYVILDQYLYPDEISKSIWICIVIGYLLYFPLMYLQYYGENKTWNNKFWTLFVSNFPQFHRNIVHALAFASCLFLWHGFWVFYDTYLRIFDKYYETYLLISLLVFIFLSVLQTFSSMNGPLKTMDDDYHFFPIYPHCYVSLVVQKLSRLSCFRSRKDQVFVIGDFEKRNKY
ncbi:unnamed protein product [Adineta ricciae]|uniref:Transmembrane protein n=1 Tax=Adineta ricciae TaxID=249248 RepID=A0A814W881_ADIRI|nr:unnamed protein product [Adineta ricciae]CAF1200574.1 unnamed protein product [Adineta ricciae]